MSVYIKGMEMPKKYPVTVIIFPDGTSVVKTISERRFTATAIPVSEHRDLISRDALVAAYDAEHVGPPGRARDLMLEAPTVIPASKEGE